MIDHGHVDETGPNPDPSHYDEEMFEESGDSRRFEVQIGDETFVVIVVPRANTARMAQLTPTERAIANEVAAGLSNAAIAKRRGRSVRTIANQIASIYRKLRVASRAELAAYLLRR